MHNIYHFLLCVSWDILVHYLQDAQTPLMYACLKGQDAIVKLMIAHGADPQAMDKVHIIPRPY